MTESNSNKTSSNNDSANIGQPVVAGPKFTIKGKSGSGSYHWKRIIEWQEMDLLIDFTYRTSSGQYAPIAELADACKTPPTIAINAMRLAPSDGDAACSNKLLSELHALGLPKVSEKISAELAEHLKERLQMSDSQLDAEDPKSPVPELSVALQAEEATASLETRQVVEATNSDDPVDDESNTIEPDATVPPVEAGDASTLSSEVSDTVEPIQSPPSEPLAEPEVKVVPEPSIQSTQTKVSEPELTKPTAKGPEPVITKPTNKGPSKRPQQNSKKSLLIVAAALLLFAVTVGAVIHFVSKSRSTNEVETNDAAPLYSEDSREEFEPQPTMSSQPILPKTPEAPVAVTQEIPTTSLPETAESVVSEPVQAEIVEPTVVVAPEHTPELIEVPIPEPVVTQVTQVETAPVKDITASVQPDLSSNVSLAAPIAEPVVAVDASEVVEEAVESSKPEAATTPELAASAEIEPIEAEPIESVVSEPIKTTVTEDEKTAEPQKKPAVKFPDYVPSF